MSKTTKAVARSTEKSTKYVALMRGINVGGKNMLPMKELVALFAKAGCGEVSSFINSGNVLFTASPALAAGLPKSIAAGIEKRFGFSVPIVLRTADELARVARSNPYLDAKTDIDLLYVGFLADEPDSARIGGLDPKRSPPDKYSVVGREIYMHLSTGAAKTKLTNAYFDSKLSTISTMRNWKTTLKLVELTKS
jgi:uncharacterized protein (DUF1697 family)